MTMSHSTNTPVIDIKSWRVQRAQSPGGSTNQLQGGGEICAVLRMFQWKVPRAALLSYRNRATKQQQKHLLSAQMKWISSDSPSALVLAVLFLSSTNPTHPEKKNVLVEAISAKRGLRFWVKCGGNQLNAELKGQRDGSQICQLLKVVRTVPAA